MFKGVPEVGLLPILVLKLGRSKQNTRGPKLGTLVKDRAKFRAFLSTQGENQASSGLVKLGVGNAQDYTAQLRVTYS